MAFCGTLSGFYSTVHNIYTLLLTFLHAFGEIETGSIVYIHVGVHETNHPLFQGQHRCDQKLHQTRTHNYIWVWTGSIVSQPQASTTYSAVPLPCFLCIVHCVVMVLAKGCRGGSGFSMPCGSSPVLIVACANDVLGHYTDFLNLELAKIVSSQLLSDIYTNGCCAAPGRIHRPKLSRW